MKIGIVAVASLASSGYSVRCDIRTLASLAQHRAVNPRLPDLPECNDHPDLACDRLGRACLFCVVLGSMLLRLPGSGLKGAQESKMVRLPSPKPALQGDGLILAAAFAPGAVVANVSRQLEVSMSLIYKWGEQALAVQPDVPFAPAVLTAELPSAVALSDTIAILVELANGTRLKIGSHAWPEWVTATLRALR